MDRERIPFTTKLGDFKAILTEANHAFVEGLNIVINSVNFNVSMHIYYVDGVWGLTGNGGSYHNLSLNRVPYDGKDASQAARNKAEKILLEALNNGVITNNMRLDAAQLKIQERHEQLKKTIEEFHDALAGAESELETVGKQLVGVVERNQDVCDTILE